VSIEHKYTFYDFPKWALSALINGDDSGISDEDIKTLDEFLLRYSEIIMWDIDADSLENGGFKNYPLFGLATDCCTVHGYTTKTEGN
jgi:hypothetical protein